jgi:hypothetical protein
MGIERDPILFLFTTGGDAYWVINLTPFSPLESLLL